MVTAIHHATLKVIFSAKNLPLESKSIWSGSRVNVSQLKQKSPGRSSISLVSKS